jgi:hypothetical protein
MIALNLQYMFMEKFYRILIAPKLPPTPGKHFTLKFFGRATVEALEHFVEMGHVGHADLITHFTYA